MSPSTAVDPVTLAETETIHAANRVDLPVPERLGPRPRLCVLGFGGGGFAAESVHLLRDCPGPMELVLVHAGSGMDWTHLKLGHPVVKSYEVWPPGMIGFSRWRRCRLLLTNLVRAYQILKETDPDMVFAVGTSQAIPFGIVARLLGIPMWFIESLTRVQAPSRTAIWIYRLRLSQRFYYYWPSLERYFPRGELAGEQA